MLPYQGVLGETQYIYYKILMKISSNSLMTLCWWRKTIIYKNWIGWHCDGGRGWEGFRDGKKWGQHIVTCLTTMYNFEVQVHNQNSWPVHMINEAQKPNLLHMWHNGIWWPQSPRTNFGNWHVNFCSPRKIKDLSKSMASQQELRHVPGPF